MAGWAHLPQDLLESISKRIDSSTDLLRFRSVCSSWRSSASPNPRRRVPDGNFRILPNDGITCTSFGFYLSKRTVFLIKPPSDSTHTSSGWVVKIEEDFSQRKHLLNPLSRYHLNPPPESVPKVLDLIGLRVCELGQEYVLHHLRHKPNSFSDVGDLYMEKIVMIWLESECLFVLLTIHVSGKLAMFKSGERKWTIINEMPSPYDDVIVYNGRLFAVDNTGRTVVVGLDTGLELVGNPVFGGDKKYLVESIGELLLVDMYLSIDTAEGDAEFGEEDFSENLVHYISEKTIKFKVFKLEEQTQSWIEVKSLGDRVLFLGDDSTFSASASDLSGCKGNCIFFVDNFFYARDQYQGVVDDGLLAGRDIRVFELDSGNIGPLRNYLEYSKLFWPPPNWVTSTSVEELGH